MRTIIEMVHHTRLDCVLGSAAIMRQGVAQATGTPTTGGVRRAARRAAADEQRAGRSRGRMGSGDGAALRLARAFDAGEPSRGARHRAARDADHQVLDVQACPPHVPRRWNVLAGRATSRSRTCRGFSAEPAQRRLGRIGQRHLPRRAARMAREPAALEAYWDEVRLAAGADQPAGQSIAVLRKREMLGALVTDRRGLEVRARRLVERLALAFQAGVLLRHAHRPSPRRSAPPASPVMGTPSGPCRPRWMATPS